MADSPNISGDDNALLDSVLDRVLERIEDGLTVDVDRLLEGRTHLRGEVEELVHLAQQIAVGSAQPRPTVPGYTILGELGHGGMGAVYLARQDRLGGRPVALKVLPRAAALSARARDRFLSEANALAKLHHPNVVTVHDVIHEGDLYAYAMEWVEGKSLGQLIEHLKGIEPEPTVADVRRFLDSPDGTVAEATLPVFICRTGVAVARALAAVHEAGLLHRDIKPSNILMRRDGTALLSDFGLVRETDTTAYTQEGHFAGTPAYAAPEQLRGTTSAIDARADVYALGVTLYHALSFRLPFRGKHTTDLLRQIQDGLCDPLRKANAKLPRDLQTIVSKAMDPDPVRRYASASDMADDLDRLLNLEPIHACPAGPVTRAVKLLRRNRRALFAAVFGGVMAATLAFLAGVYLLWVPGWVDEHVREARMRLLNPLYAELVYIQQVKGIEQDAWAKSANGAATRYDEAVSEYDKALPALLFRRDYRRIRLERDTVALASTILKGKRKTANVPDAFVEHAPMIAGIGRRWIHAGGPQPVANRALGNADSDELRCLGLLAYLCFDPELCRRAFEQAGADLAASPDPLADVATGVAYLVERDGPRAMVRLDRALQWFPESPYLWVSLADAAVRSRELGLADRLLERIRERSKLENPNEFDPFGVFGHAEAAFYATRDAPGDRERARVLFAAAAARRKAPETRIRYAEFLTKWGDLEAAAEVRRPIPLVYPDDMVAHVEFVEAVERWWASLDEEGRRRKRDDDPDYRGLYEQYLGSKRRVAEAEGPWKNARMGEDAHGHILACDGYPLQEPYPPLGRGGTAEPTQAEQQTPAKNP